MKNNKKLFVTILCISIIFVSSCSATKRDCRGNKKHRLSNGIYM